MRFNVHTLRSMGEGDGDYDYTNITIHLLKLRLDLQFFFYPVSQWWLQCLLLRDSCFLLEHTQFGLILPTMELKYQHFYG